MRQSIWRISVYGYFLNKKAGFPAWNIWIFCFWEIYVWAQDRHHVLFQFATGFYSSTGLYSTDPSHGWTVTRKYSPVFLKSCLWILRNFAKYLFHGISVNSCFYCRKSYSIEILSNGYQNLNCCILQWTVSTSNDLLKTPVSEKKG